MLSHFLCFKYRSEDSVWKDIWYMAFLAFFLFGFLALWLSGFLVHMSAHPRSLMPPSFSRLHPYRLQTSAHPRSLMPTGPSPHPFPTSLAPVPSAHVRASTLAHAHRSFSLPISNLSLAPTPSTRPRTHARSCPPALLPTHFQFFPSPTPSAHVRASTLAHAHRPFSPPISNFFLAPKVSALAHAGPFPHPFNFSLAPAPSAKNVRASTLAHAHRSFSPPISPFPCTNCPHISPHPRSLMPTGPSPQSCPTSLPPTPSAHIRASMLVPTGPFSPPISNLSLAPTPSAHACASTLPHAHRSFSPHHLHTSAHPRSLIPTGPSPYPFPTFPLHPHCPHTSVPTGPSLHPFPTFPCTHTVRTRPRIHALMPTGPSATHFQLCSLHPHLAHTSAHPRSLMPTGPFPNPFPTFPLHPHRPHTSAHPCSLMPTGASPHPFNISLAPAPSAHVRASVPSTHFQPFPLHPFRLHTSMIHARSCPPVLLPTHFQPFLAPTPSAHFCISTLAHAHLPHPLLTFPISNFSLAPVPSAHVRVPRWLMPTGPCPHPFPSFPLRPHCLHTSVRLRSARLADSTRTQASKMLLGKRLGC